jgi:hypothetical protein
VADTEFSGRGPGTLGGGNTESNLTGFSSNAHWAEDADDNGAYWSHHPVHLGPKDGFHDPIEADPVRQGLWDPQNQTGRSDDTINGRY